MKKNKYQEAIELIHGGKFVEFTQAQHDAMKEGRLICPHGCEDDIVQVEVATIYRRENIRVEAEEGFTPTVVVNSLYEVNDEGGGASWYECHCRAEPKEDEPYGEYIGAMWELPSEYNEDWE